MIPLPYRIGAYVVTLLLVMAALAWGVHEFNQLRAQAARVPALEQAVRDAAATLDHERKAAAKAQEISRGYQTDLADIRADRDRLRDLPPRVVRVLVPARAPASAGSATAGGSGGTPATAIELEGEAGSGTGQGWDIGPGLYRIVDDADQREAELGAQVTRLQEAYAVAEQACRGSP